MTGTRPRAVDMAGEVDAFEIWGFWEEEHRFDVGRRPISRYRPSRGGQPSIALLLGRQIAGVEGPWCH